MILKALSMPWRYGAPALILDRLTYP